MNKHRMDSDRFNRDLGKSREVHFQDGIAPESMQKESLVNWSIFLVPWPDCNWLVAALVDLVAHIQT